MRRPQLEMLRGGGEEAPCDLCARGLFLGEGDEVDVVTKERIRAFAAAARAANRIRLCGAHREDLEGMGVQLCAPLAEAKPARRQRRAMAAVVRRAHRASLPRPAPPKPEPRRGGGGGVEF